MLLDDDLYAIGLPEDQLTPEIEAEYLLRQQMYHARGGQGMLPVDMVIDMLRFCGHVPAATVKEAKAVDWRKVPVGRAVIVDEQGQKVLGEYVGMLDLGTLAVRIAGRLNLPDFSTYQVSLAPDVIPPDVLVPGEIDKDLLDESADEPEEPPQREVERTPKGPAADAKWLTLAAGDAVLVNGQPAEFIEEGPSDGMLTVMLSGSSRPVYVDELEVEIVPPAPQRKARTKGAKK